MATPEPVHRLVDAVNRGDSEGFLDAFTDDGYVDDNGRTFTGSDEIGVWSDREFIGKNGQMDVTGSRDTAEGTSLDVEVTSDGFNGYSRFDFVVAGDLVGAMVIRA